MYFISFEKKRRKSIQNGCLNTPLLMKIVEKQIQNEKKNNNKFHGWTEFLRLVQERVQIRCVSGLKVWLRQMEPLDRRKRTGCWREGVGWFGCCPPVLGWRGSCGALTTCNFPRGNKLRRLAPRIFKLALILGALRGLSRSLVSLMWMCDDCHSSTTRWRPSIHCFLLCSLNVTSVALSVNVSTLKTCLVPRPLPEEPGRNELLRPTLVPKSTTLNRPTSKGVLYRLSRLLESDRVKTSPLSNRKHCNFKPWLVFRGPSQMSVVALVKTGLISSDASIWLMTCLQRPNPVDLSTRSNMFVRIRRTCSSTLWSPWLSGVNLRICLISRGYFTRRDLGTSKKKWQKWKWEIKENKVNVESIYQDNSRHPGDVRKGIPGNVWGNLQRGDLMIFSHLKHFSLWFGWRSESHRFPVLVPLIKQCQSYWIVAFDFMGGRKNKTDVEHGNIPIWGVYFPQIQQSHQALWLLSVLL